MKNAKIDKSREVWDAWERGEDPLDRDLSDFVATGDWKWAIVRRPKDKTVTLRMPGSLVESTKAMAKQEGVAYQSLMRDLVAEGLQRRRQGAFIAAENMEMTYPKAKAGKKKKV